MTGDTGAPLIVFADAAKSYGGIPALLPAAVSIQRGEFAAIIGTSGCGKTTFLKLCNGLILPDSGSVTVAGQDTKTANLIALRRSIGYVIQTTGLFPHMTVAQNIAYIPRLTQKLSRSAAAALTEELLHTVGLSTDYAKRYPCELSGGQMQRVGIARALASRPRLLLMDEPFSAVDEITRRKLQQEIKRIWREWNLTILFVTHDIREALKLASRVLVMDKGAIVQDAPPEIIKTQPGTAFVRELISDLSLEL